MSNPSRMLPQADLIAAKMEQLRAKLRVVETESLDLHLSLGRVLGQDIMAFRDSPSMDVSAMDGYAVRIADLDGGALPICGTSTAGSPPIPLKIRSAVRVFTGGPVPPEAQCVVRREDCNESESYVTVCLSKDAVREGLNIRRQAENARKGDSVLTKGQLLTPTQFAGAVTFQHSSPLQVFRQVRVGIINTGDELVEFGAPVESWQIRDSNGPFLEAMLSSHRWIDSTRTKVVDHQAQTQKTIEDHLDRCDVILMTGGVSMGDTDYVPDAILGCGGEVIFHRIPIRPGKPLLGAVGPRGQLILGLPGNPLSVAVTFRRFAMDLIRHIGGITQASHPPIVSLDSDSPKTIDLAWFRLVRLGSDGRLTLVDSQGSGDIASLAQSDGFVEIPPNQPAMGNWPYYSW